MGGSQSGFSRLQATMKPVESKIGKEGRNEEGWWKRKWEGKKVGGVAVVQAVTEGVLNNSQLDTPSWFVTPFSILISEDVYCALSTRTGLCAGQNQLLAAWCGPTCCAGTRSAVSPHGSLGCAVKQNKAHTINIRLKLSCQQQLLLWLRNNIRWLWPIKMSVSDILQICQHLLVSSFCTLSRLLLAPSVKFKIKIKRSWSMRRSRLNCHFWVITHHNTNNTSFPISCVVGQCCTIQKCL